jgi:hypothetical protein
MPGRYLPPSVDCVAIWPTTKGASARKNIGERCLTDDSFQAGI